jgi:acetate kinase
VRILVVNAGSSTLKLSVLDDGDRLVGHRKLAASSGDAEEQDVAGVISDFGAVDAVGHRIVHGGTEFVESVLVDDHVVERLELLVDLAPLHQPASLRALDVARRLLPGKPAVACFDTAFHSRIPAAAATYALPAEWRERWELKRFGFHGLAHAYAARKSAALTGRRVEQLRIVTCHLGAGASLAAVDGGVSVDTTMGFTPLEGLVMATRSGSVDPGLVLWLEEHVGMEPIEVASALEHRSGLLGLAGSADMEVVLESEAAGDPAAALAVGVYLHRLRAAIASMAAAMGGMDVLVFTGGVGEGAATIRSRAGQGLAFLGVSIDDVANGRNGADREVSGANSAVRSFVVEAREDLEIARDVRRVVASSGRQ